MWSNGGGIADHLSREFRAMSSERDRKWGGTHGSYPRSGSGGGGSSRARSSPLRYSSAEWRERGAYEGYQPIGRYSQQDASRDKWNGGVTVAPVGRNERDPRKPARAGRYSGANGGRSRSQNTRNYRSRRNSRSTDDDDEDEDSYSYSYSYSSSESDSAGSTNSSSSSSGYDARDRGRRGARPAPRARGDGRGLVPRPVRYTPTGPTGAARTANPEGAVHWVGDNAAGRVALQQQQQQHVPDGGFNGQAAAMAPQMPALQPSGLLRRVVEAVAYYRGVPMPSTIPSEVTLAFDEYVSRGSTMLKFLPHGPPHSRYFIIRFLDVIPGGRRRGGGEGTMAEAAMPHAVLAWYRNASSRHMIRFLPLHDLMDVKADGADHPYVQRRTVQPGMLRGPRTGLSTNYVYADFILQFRFRSRLSRGEETLALKTANRTQHLAWLVVGSFISQVGRGGGNQFH